ncbi:MAG TPA: hypothetical protein DER04_06155 [Holosporales bacterium]|nr:hypothetical protein [Holosporales bacterium]HBW24744.1 hypothetical protein [Holosporales bacterium]HCE96330.1 hypothetical protein [Holosporales bacterium]
MRRLLVITVSVNKEVKDQKPILDKYSWNGKPVDCNTNTCKLEVQITGIQDTKPWTTILNNTTKYNTYTCIAEDGISCL